MAQTNPEKIVRRIAVILGTGGSGRNLLDLVRPLLSRDRGIEMEGVFLEEAGLKQAADLPFVKELCRLTFTVREFQSSAFERDLARRIRSARRLLEHTAGRAGVGHSFRNVRGPAVRLLRETVTASDITVFEPMRSFASTLQGPSRARQAPWRIVVAVADLVSGTAALVAASRLLRGRPRQFSVLLTPDAAADRRRIERLARRLLHGETVYFRLLPGTDIDGIVTAIRKEFPALLVLGATESLLEGDSLRLLRERLRCPICLVRNWDEMPEATN